MELKELEYVVTVAEAGSISRAAERLYLAQSSLSQFLSRCEAELGVRLFMRTAGGVRLTQSGETYVRTARQMLRQYHRLKEELQELNQPGGGRIDFGISSFRGSYLLPRVLDQFRRQYPGVEAVIHEHDSQVLVKKLAAGELDMGLVALSPEGTPGPGPGGHAGRGAAGGLPGAPGDGAGPLGGGRAALGGAGGDAGLRVPAV